MCLHAPNLDWKPATITLQPRLNLEGRAEVAKLGMEAETVPSYGIPRDVVLSAEPFSAENGLRTPTNKLNRVKVKKAFASRLNVLFEMPSAADVLGTKGCTAPVCQGSDRRAKKRCYSRVFSSSSCEYLPLLPSLHLTRQFLFNNVSRPRFWRRRRR